MAVLGNNHDAMMLTWCQNLSEYSTCYKMQYGAFLRTKDRQLFNGVNGWYPNDVLDVDGQPLGCQVCLRFDVPSGTRHELCRAMHAEQVAMLRAWMKGASTQGATVWIAGRYAGEPSRMFIKDKPGFYCTTCARFMQSAGIQTVVVPVSVAWAFNNWQVATGIQHKTWVPVRLTMSEVWESAYAVAEGKEDALGNPITELTTDNTIRG